MATITTKLTVTGSAADYGAALALSVSDNLQVTAPSKGISRFDLAVGVNSVILDAGDAGTTFLYVKNNNTTGSGSIQIETAGGTDYGTIENGEWAWIPIDTAVGCRLTGAGATVEVEYAFWSRT